MVSGRFSEIWNSDAGAIKACVLVEVISTFRHERIIIRRLLSWDESPLPSWCKDWKGPDFRVQVRDVRGLKLDTLRSQLLPGTPLSTNDANDVRRFLPEVTTWLESLPSSSHWGLLVPCVCYEFWPPESQHQDALAAWDDISDASRRALISAGVMPNEPGYAGALVAHFPQRMPYPLDIHTLVVPQGTENEKDVRIELDYMVGEIRVSRTSAPLRVFPGKAKVGSLEQLRILRPGGTFNEINSCAELEESEHALTPAGDVETSPDLVILSVDAGRRYVTSSTMGLIRQFGSIGPAEPWTWRAPHLGFSPPSITTHVAPNPALVGPTIRWLGSVGRKGGLCDPYGERSEVEELARYVPRLRVLVSARSYAAHFKSRWWQPLGLEVRVPAASDKFHDRFLVGQKRGFLIGHSLNGIGKSHSFITELDYENARVLRRVFEDMWKAGATPP